MLKEEFEKLSGIYPSEETYKYIEGAYYAFSGTKQDFCHAYKFNIDGIAKKIQFAVDQAAYKTHQHYNTELTNKNTMIARLEHELEEELEWRHYEDANNVSQADYLQLRDQSDTRILSDLESKNLLYDWYGFAKDKIKILHTVPVYEVNRHHKLRKSGEYQRDPLYNATDWNYIRFDCGCMRYELENDNLRLYLH